jgi:hypothetical protein
MSAHRDALIGEPELSATTYAAHFADALRSRAAGESVDPLALVRELFLYPLPAFVADALEDTLGHLRCELPPEGVDSS